MILTACLTRNLLLENMSVLDHGGEGSDSGSQVWPATQFNFLWRTAFANIVLYPVEEMKKRWGALSQLK